jgi:hypothetical protein
MMAVFPGSEVTDLLYKVGSKKPDSAEGTDVANLIIALAATTMLWMTASFRPDHGARRPGQQKPTCCSTSKSRTCTLADRSAAGGLAMPSVRVTAATRREGGGGDPGGLCRGKACERPRSRIGGPAVDPVVSTD